MLNTYDFTIAPNASRRLDAPGNYISYYAGSAGGSDSTITVQGLSSGLRVILKPGQAIRLPDTAKPETSWLLYNFANSGTIIGTLLVGDGEFEDHTITGNVSIIDSPGANVQTPALAVPPLTVGFNATQWIAPAANINGIVIRYSNISVTAGATGTVNSRITAAASAPITMAPGANSLLICTAFNDTTTVKTIDVPTANRKIPAGWGVWFCSNIVTAAATVNGGALSYEIL